MEQLGIIRKVGYGCRDVGHPVLFFDIMISENVGALQVLSGKEADDFIKAYGVYDVKDLNNKPVWVNVDGNQIRILRPCLLLKKEEKWIGKSGICGDRKIAGYK